VSGRCGLANRKGSVVKRQKERARQERQKLKLERRAQRNAERRERSAAGGEDLGIAATSTGAPPRLASDGEPGPIA
jgi:hypothetical protein